VRGECINVLGVYATINRLAMKTRRHSSLLLFALCGIVVQPSMAQTTPESAVVRITAKEGERSKTGTGFIVQLTQDIAYIVTASHVIEGDDEPQVEFFTRRDRPVKAAIKAAEVGDPKGLALLVVSGKEALGQGLSVLAIDTSTLLKSGDEVMAIGFPRMGGDWAVSKGNLSARQGRELIFTMPVGEGNSGGPLIKDGKVIALVTSEAQGRAFAAAAASVKLFLEGSGVQGAAASASTPQSPPTTEAKPSGGAAPGAVSVEQALALIGAGQTEAQRFTILRDLARKRSLSGPISAAQMQSLVQGFGDSSRAAAIDALKALVAPDLTTADALALMGNNAQEAMRLRIMQSLFSAGRVRRPLSAEDAVALLERFHDNLRMSGDRSTHRGGLERAANFRADGRAGKRGGAPSGVDHAGARRAAENAVGARGEIGTRRRFWRRLSHQRAAGVAVGASSPAITCHAFFPLALPAHRCASASRSIWRSSSRR
jgi:hypothetical protein